MEHETLKQELNKMAWFARNTKEKAEKLEAEKLAQKIIKKLPSKLKKAAKKGKFEYQISNQHYISFDKVEIMTPILRKWAESNGLFFKIPNIWYIEDYYFCFRWQ